MYMLLVKKSLHALSRDINSFHWSEGYQPIKLYKYFLIINNYAYLYNLLILKFFLLDS